MLPATVLFLKNGRKSYETVSYTSKHSTLSENHSGQFSDYRSICLYYRTKRDRKRGGVTSFSMILGNWKEIFHRNRIQLFLLSHPVFRPARSGICNPGSSGHRHGSGRIPCRHRILFLHQFRIHCFDVIALILNKKNPKINIALTMYLINTCVLLFGLLSYGITSVLTGIGFTALQSLTLNCLLKRKE